MVMFLSNEYIYTWNNFEYLDKEEQIFVDISLE